MENPEIRKEVKPRGIEVYLSRDIIQGEEVPFYILWERNDIQRIILELTGFESITEYHNVRDGFSLEERAIESKDLKSPQYLGGVLKTEETENPYMTGSLRVILELSSGENIEINEERTLYTTHLKINSPEHIEVPFRKPPIEIQLKGSTTIFINIESADDSDVEIILPEEIRNAFEKVYQSFLEGIENLKNEYPEYSSEIDLLFSFIFEERLSEQEFHRKFKEISELFKSNKVLLEGLAIVFVNSILSQGSIRDSYFRPLLEYFESNAAKKAFFESPFLAAKIPKGGGFLRAIIYYEDIIERIKKIKDAMEKSDSVENLVRGFIEETEGRKIGLDVYLKSRDEKIIPIKDMVNVRRIFDEESN
jgi:hypothetical protein